jgi:cyclomaltodextrinase
MREWTEHVIWWHVYPLGFVGADTTGADRTPTHDLRRLEGWLDDVIALGANGLALGPIFASSTHGYDTLDYFRIDERLGDESDFASLVAAAHDRGIRVLLDGVFNHVGRDFADTSIVREGAVFEGHDSLVELDHDDPAVADLVARVMIHWLDRGADGWRLDAAYSVPPSFWARVLPRVREAHPDAYIVGEVLHGDYAAIVRESGMDSVTQYELWQASWHAIADANLFELDWTLSRHNELLDEFVPYTFVGNHDVTRLATRIPEARHRAHALVLLFTLGGTPSVYYGDERGLEGLKEERFGGDDAIRPEFPASPGELDSEVPDGRAVFALHQELIAVRRRHAWLHRARSRTLALANESLVLEVSSGADRLVVALNLGDAPLDLTSIDGADASDVIAGHIDGRRVPPHGWVVLA